MSEVDRQTKGTVLIVEDDSTMAGIVLEILLDEGYAASLLGDSSSDAFRGAIGRLEPDCILLDSLAGQESFDATWIESVWAHSRARPVPVVLFTVNRRVSDEATGKLTERSESVFGVVAKPFDMDVLLDMIARATRSLERFDRSWEGDRRRSAHLVARVEVAGAREVRASTRREWVSFEIDGAMTILYWSQRDGVYYVLREPVEAGPLCEIGHFHDLDCAVNTAIAIDA